MKSIFLICILTMVSCGTAYKKRTDNNSEYRDQVKVALVQYPIQGSVSLEDFLNKTSSYIESAADQGVELIVFPELVTLDMWPSKSVQTDLKIVSRISRYSQSVIDHWKDLAIRKKINIVAGSTPVLDRSKLFNRSYLILSSGEVLQQDKMTLTPWGKKTGFQTGDRLNVFDTPLGKISVLICYDVESPQLSAQLTKVAPHLDLIVVPSMTESIEGLRRVRYTSLARAVEHHAFVLVAGTTGNPTDEWRHFGQSVIAGPQYPGYPKTVAEADLNQADLLIHTINLKKLRASKLKNEFYPALESPKGLINY